MKQPTLLTYLELNQRYGKGYQGRIVMEGVLESVIDDEPFTLDEAYGGCVCAIEQINEECGYNYIPHEVIQITKDAIDANKKTDFTTAKIAQDIKKGHGELAVPISVKPDIQHMTIDGKQEDMVSALGSVILTYATIHEEPKNTKAKAVMMKYCQYLAMHRYGNSAKNIFKEIVKKDKECAINWIRATFDKYINDQMDLIQCMFGQ